MLQVKNRTITLSYTQPEIEQVNKILEEIQAIPAFHASTMKGLFLKILENSIDSERNSNEIQTLNSEIHEKFKSEIQRLTTENAELSEENKLLTLSLEEIQNTQPQKEDISFNLFDKEKAILQLIQERRFEQLRVKGVSDPETFSEIVRKGFFNKGTLYNWGGEFPTFLG